MIPTIADTNAILWFTFDPARLTPNARSALLAAEEANELHIATVTLVELNYLETKPRFEYPGALARIEAMLADPNVHLNSLDLTVVVAKAVASVPRKEVPDMPDRIICSTAVAHKYQLVSSDTEIRNSPTLNQLITVIW